METRQIEIDPTIVTQEPTLGMPTEPLYLNSWTRIPVSLTQFDPSFDDLVFWVEPPEAGCTVSYSRDVFSDPAKPDILLIAGGLVADCVLHALDKNTGNEIAAEKFSVIDVWTGKDGPPLAIVGEVGTGQPEGTWGGGPWTEPQNVEVYPQFGDRQVAVVILETSDNPALSAADAAALRTRLQNQIFDGVTGGGSESTSAYFAEVSHSAFGLANAGVIGPIRLANTFAGYSPAVVDAALNRWNGLEAFARAGIAEIRRQNDLLVAAGQPPLIDLLTVQSILFVVRTLPAPPPPPPPGVPMPGASQWPFASRPGSWERSFQVGTQIISISFPFGSIDIPVPIERIIQIIAMPDDWETLEASARTFQDTAAHELGHNLGLPDQYARTTHAADIQSRDPSNWTLMSFEDDLTHLTTAEKLILGWTRKEWVLPLSFAVIGPVDEPVTLQAAELGAPPFGLHAAVEVRKGDGLNYYFEYRRTQGGGIGDQDLPENGVVLATEFVSGTTEPADRRTMLLIRDDSDADGGTFALNDDYEEQDTTSPEYPNDFIVDVLSVSPSAAQLRIRYGDQKPDPQLTPWSAQSNWKSPDLEVRNARTAANPMYRDVPWEGHTNTLHARVRNRGEIDAPGVTVNFAVKDYTLTNGAETSLGSETRDVPAGATVEFTAPNVWIPPITSIIIGAGLRAHYCTVARITPYAHPLNPAVKEVTTANNEAQSNHTQLLSVFASPASREVASVSLFNDREEATRFHPIVRQTSPLARTYLEHAWVELQPLERRDVKVYTEWIVGDETLAPVVEEYGIERAFKEPNILRMTGVAEEPCSGTPLGGGSFTVPIGMATEFVRFEVDENATFYFGRIVFVGTNQGVDGDVLISVRPVDRPEEEITIATIAVGGEFEAGAEHQLSGTVEVQAYYLGGFGLGACESWIETRDV